jgi:hypothetical protein
METDDLLSSEKTSPNTPVDILIPTTAASASATASLAESEAVSPKEPVTVASPYEVAANELKKMLEKEEAANGLKIGEDAEDSGFNLVDIEKELKIIKALEQLRAMGYSDDGGWLTRLASTKGGNLNAILDAISPFGNK